MAITKKIVLIEDDRDISSTLRGVLESNGHQVVAAPNGIEGQKLIQSEKPDLGHHRHDDAPHGRVSGVGVLGTLDNPPKVIMITANEGGRQKPMRKCWA